jgi:hypothetical protein
MMHGATKGPDKLDVIWNDDLLKRRSDAEFLFKFWALGPF